MRDSLLQTLGGLILAVVVCPAAAAELPAPGRFLIAADELQEPNFSRTVVLLARYGPRGSLGIVLNRSTEVRVSQVFPELEGPGVRQRIWRGGPVEPGEWGMLVRTANAPENALHVFADVYLTDDPELLAAYVGDADQRGRFRVYAGYAGWGPGQLDAEIAHGGWHVVPGDVDVVFSPADDGTWRELLPRNPQEWTLHPLRQLVIAELRR